LNSTSAIAAELAKWFDKIIDERKIRPNVKGEYIFALLRSDFERFLGDRNFTNYLRIKLLSYGYSLRRYQQRAEVTVIKFLN